VITTWSQRQVENECQQSVNDLMCFIVHYPLGVLRHLPIGEVLVACIGIMFCVNPTTPQASMEAPQLLLMCLKESGSDFLVAIHNQHIANQYQQK
jgi:hypothetical protein